jgi:hypothetical protein
MDPVLGIRLELDMTRRVEPLNGLDESQDAGINQVFQKNMRWKPIVDSLGDIFDLGKLFHQQALAFR